MEYRSRSFRIDDEVWAAIQKHELSANKLLRIALGLEEATLRLHTGVPGVKVLPDDSYDGAQLDAIGPELSSGRGKATTQTRGIRQKGDGKR